MRTRRQAREDTERNHSASLSLPKARKRKENAKSKPKANSQKVEPTKKVKKDEDPAPATRKSGRSKGAARVKESPAQQSKSKKGEKKSVEKKDRKSVKGDKKSAEKEEKSASKRDRKGVKKQVSASKESEKSKQQKDKKKEDGEKEDAKKVEKEEKKQKVKTVVVKGAAPIDEYFDKNLAKSCHVLATAGHVFSTTLNQTNIKNNNNKFYILQVVQSDTNAEQCYLFTRWGRVGVPGQYSCEGPYTAAVACNLYNRKKHDKSHKGDYRVLDMNYGDEEEEENPANDGEAKAGKDPLSDYQESKLPKDVKDFINLIFDLNMMNNQMKQIGYNVNKMPLGKLSKDNIKKGYDILKALYEELENKKRQSVMEDLTNDFYSYIPHDVGFRNMGAFMLDNIQKVKQKLEMLESLAEIKIATEILSKGTDGNTIDSNYQKLNRELKPVPKDSFTFKLIDDYLQTTHAKTHRGYDLELMTLLEVNSEMEDKRFTKDLHNRFLLWHGSRLTNYVGILSQGLRIAPPEAPVTGYMFGKGVYFADMSSKSANYCFTNPNSNIGVLILCEVALGDMNEKFHADYYASNLPDGKHSTKGVGRTAPKPENYTNLDGAILPMGPGFDNPSMNASLMYNEYIVYKLEQIRIKYILKTKFNYKRSLY